MVYDKTDRVLKKLSNYKPVTFNTAITGDFNIPIKSTNTLQDAAKNGNVVNRSIILKPLVSSGFEFIRGYKDDGTTVLFNIKTDANNYVETYFYNSTGGVGIFLSSYAGGTSKFNSKVMINSSDNAVASASLEIKSSTTGFLPPRMTSVQKSAISNPATGLIVYDTTLNKLCVYTGAAWETITSA